MSALDKLPVNDQAAIRVTDTGNWVVTSDQMSYPLEEIEDFFRVRLLLERRFAEAKEALELVGQSSNASKPFPMWMVVASALQSASFQWTDRALAWVAFLTEPEKVLLKDLLAAVKDSRGASQKSRQLARKYLNQIVN
jgi:hypothetical protein